ncbi:MAG: malate dehydrogenase [Planctomycetes bacterium]|nr:malate dehydrogenase [Planctomycetota bacterium]MCB9825748.1 malate dehydrogenase [Planctomycetota bacterium]MCB9830003.1 malate dehydrogenase [Planctomycetota bacterium]
MRKVAIIGGGNVGATCAYQLASRDAADVAVYDIVEGVPAGKALDMTQVGPVFGFDARVTGSHEVDVIAGAEVVVVTAGFPRKPGMDRMDLLKKNADIARASGEAIRRYAPDSVVVTVTNPLDVMTWVVQQATGFEPSRVVGMAGVLDSARFATFIAMELGASAKDVRAMVLGGHGDSMVPLPRFSTVNGVPITELMPADRIASLSDRTRNGGAEIVKLLGTGSAFYAPGASAALMVEAILGDTRRLVPASAWTGGAYGLDGVYIGVPVQLGASGVHKIVELELSADEKAALERSAATVAQGIADVKALSA